MWLLRDSSSLAATAQLPLSLLPRAVFCPSPDSISHYISNIDENYIVFRYTIWRSLTLYALQVLASSHQHQIERAPLTTSFNLLSSHPACVGISTCRFSLSLYPSVLFSSSLFFSTSENQSKEPEFLDSASYREPKIQTFILTQ